MATATAINKPNNQVKITFAPPLPDADEEATRAIILRRLEANPEEFLSEYTRQFGNVLNADSAATLFSEYNSNPAKYRVAVHPAAQWIRDELYRRARERRAAKGKNRVVFTAGGNASGKSTAIEFSGAAQGAHVVFDSTFSNREHAAELIERALSAGKAVSILYVNRPLNDALEGMIGRAEIEGRIVTIEQLIKSQRGAAATVRELWNDFRDDPKIHIYIRHQ